MAEKVAPIKAARTKLATQADDDQQKQHCSADQVVVVFKNKMRMQSQRDAHYVIECRHTMSNVLADAECYPSDKGDISLKISLLKCTEGDRCGRICCGKLGMGWVVLKAEWQLVQKDGTPLAAKHHEKLRDSGGLGGCLDLCQRDIGHTRLIELADEMARKIARESKKELRDCHQR